MNTIKEQMWLHWGGIFMCLLLSLAMSSTPAFAVDKEELDKAIAELAQEDPELAAQVREEASHAVQEGLIEVTDKGDKGIVGTVDVDQALAEIDKNADKLAQQGVDTAALKDAVKSGDPEKIKAAFGDLDGKGFDPAGADFFKEFGMGEFEKMAQGGAPREMEAMMREMGGPTPEMVEKMKEMGMDPEKMGPGHEMSKDQMRDVIEKGNFSDTEKAAMKEMAERGQDFGREMEQRGREMGEAAAREHGGFDRETAMREMAERGGFDKEAMEKGGHDREAMEREAFERYVPERERQISDYREQQQGGGTPPPEPPVHVHTDQNPAPEGHPQKHF